MQTQVVGSKEENFVLIIAEDKESKMSFNFECNEAELMNLYLQIRDKLKLP